MSFPNMGVLKETTFQSNYVIRNISNGLSLMVQDKTTLGYFLILLFIIFLALVGPTIAPYHYSTSIYQDGELQRTASPSMDHPLGTTSSGQDVLSRMLYGARPTVITGLLGGFMIITIGMSIGLISGYLGGTIDNILMRATDFAYGIPLIPLAIVSITLIGAGFYQSIIVIGLILWRGPARVIRSQVLQIKERPFILAAKTTGASSPRIVITHILPNIASMGVLFFAMGIGYTIIIQAGLAFVGVTNPFVPSWGIMIRNAYTSGWMTTAWWWIIPPCLGVALTVLSTFMFGRGYENIVNEDVEAMTVAG